MKKKAVILDLDNTIYPVPAIGEELFAPLFELIKNAKGHEQDYPKIRDEMMRRPFQYVARDYGFSSELKREATAILKDLSFERHIEPFADYRHVKSWDARKYLVTTGFPKMQQSKIDLMGLEADFDEIHIVDPSVTDKTKKDVFADILQRMNYKKEEIIVVGDDPDSEIRAARELGIDAVLYDKNNMITQVDVSLRINDFSELAEYFDVLGEG